MNEMWSRRLLRAYPRGHREEYGEEMVGVLLARGGSVRECADVLRGGLVLRLRTPAPDLRGDGWRDALAVVSLLAPLILLADSLYWLDRLAARELPLEQLVTGPAPRLVGLYGWPLVLAAATWFGRPGRLVAVAGAGALALSTLWAYSQDLGQELWFSTGYTALALLPVVAVAGLAFSAGPRHGARVLGRRGRALVLGTAAAAFEAEPLLNLRAHEWSDPLPGAGHSVYLDAWLACLGVMAVFGLRSATGRRVAALLTAPGLSCLLALRYHAPSLRTLPWTSVLLLVYVLPVVAGVGAVLVLGRHRRSPAPDSSR